MLVSGARRREDSCTNAAPGRLFDAPERPSQAPKRQDLLSLLVAQDVAHPGEGPCRPCRRQRLSRGPLMAGFHVSINGRFWVSPEDTAARGWRSPGPCIANDRLRNGPAPDMFLMTWALQNRVVVSIWLAMPLCDADWFVIAGRDIISP